MSTAMKIATAAAISRPFGWLNELRKGDAIGVLSVQVQYREEIYVESVDDAGNINCSDGKTYDRDGVCNLYDRQTSLIMRPTVESSADFKARALRTRLAGFAWRGLNAIDLQAVIDLASERLGRTA